MAVTNSGSVWTLSASSDVVPGPVQISHIEIAGFTAVSLSKPGGAVMWASGTITPPYQLSIDLRSVRGLVLTATGSGTVRLTERLDSNR